MSKQRSKVFRVFKFPIVLLVASALLILIAATFELHFVWYVASVGCSAISSIMIVHRFLKTERLRIERERERRKNQLKLLEVKDLMLETKKTVMAEYKVSDYEDIDLSYYPYKQLLTEPFVARQLGIVMKGGLLEKRKIIICLN